MALLRACLKEVRESRGETAPPPLLRTGGVKPPALFLVKPPAQPPRLPVAHPSRTKLAAAQRPQLFPSDQE